MLIVAPSPLALGSTDIDVALGSTAQIVNVGRATITLGALTSSDPRFVITGPLSGTVLERNASATLGVRFTSSTPGPAATTLTIAVADPPGTAAATVTASATVRDAVVAGAFVARVGPDDSSIGRAGCDCRAGKDFGDGNGFTILPAALVRLRYEVVDTAAVCARPADAACGFNDTCNRCSLGARGEARWRAARFALDVRTGEDWIIDEAITHSGGGADGDFSVKATLVDDCKALQGSTNSTINTFCCVGSCEDNDFSCYDLAFTGCANDCSLASGQVSRDGGCLQRGPIAVRVSLAIDGIEQQLCGTMTGNQSIELARVQRRAGVFSIVSTAAAFRSIAVGAPCE